jgi:hypothetical protein
MGKVVPYLIPYKLIFLFKIFDQEEASFLSNQIVFSFEIHFKSKLTLLLSGPAQLSPFPGRPTPVRTNHARRPAPLLPHGTHVARPAPVSSAPTRLPGARPCSPPPLLLPLCGIAHTRPHPPSSPYVHDRAYSPLLFFSPALALKPPRDPLSSPPVRAKRPT